MVPGLDNFSVLVRIAVSRRLGFSILGLIDVSEVWIQIEVWSARHVYKNPLAERSLLACDFQVVKAQGTPVVRGSDYEGGNNGTAGGVGYQQGRNLVIIVPMVVRGVCVGRSDSGASILAVNCGTVT